jgi:hypothetical protein
LSKNDQAKSICSCAECFYILGMFEAMPKKQGVFEALD